MSWFSCCSTSCKDQDDDSYAKSLERLDGLDGRFAIRLASDDQLNIMDWENGLFREEDDKVLEEYAVLGEDNKGLDIDGNKLTYDDPAMIELSTAEGEVATLSSEWDKSFDPLNCPLVEDIELYEPFSEPSPIKTKCKFFKTEDRGVGRERSSSKGSKGSYTYSRNKEDSDDGEDYEESGGKKEREKSDHRASCHRCGNIRKNSHKCVACPQIYCKVCFSIQHDEHGPNVFDKGCPKCLLLCCCGKNKSVNCKRNKHCYRKCPSSKVGKEKDKKDKEEDEDAMY